MHRRTIIPSIILLVSLFLTGCSGSSTWYQLEKFVAQEPEKIVEELENNQGLEYDVQGDYYVWAGTPKNPLSEEGAHEEFTLIKRDVDGEIRPRVTMSKDELMSGEEIVGAEIVFASNALNNGSLQTTADEITKKLGFSNQSAEGEYYAGWERIGPCKIDGKDAYWQIQFTDNFCHVEIRVDETDYLEQVVEALANRE